MDSTRIQTNVGEGLLNHDVFKTISWGIYWVLTDGSCETFLPFHSKFGPMGIQCKNHPCLEQMFYLLEIMLCIDIYRIDSL